MLNCFQNVNLLLAVILINTLFDILQWKVNIVPWHCKLHLGPLSTAISAIGFTNLAASVLGLS